MTSSLVPLSSSALSEELDFSGLLRESLTVIQGLGGQQWANLNASDPGYTILEQLCYALTELGYRAGLPVPTLLAAGNANTLPLSAHGLYSAPDLFPSAALSIADQRRMLLDRCTEIANVWFELVTPGRDANSARTPSRSTSGLYRLVVLPNDANQWYASSGQPSAVSDPLIIKSVQSCYASTRNLCEDVDCIDVLKPHSLVIESLRLLLEPQADPDQVLANVLYQAGLFLNPEPKRQSLQKRLASLPVGESLLAGVLPSKGFIADDQLAARPHQLDLARLGQLISAIDGVIELEDIGFSPGSIPCDSGPSDAIAIPEGFYFRLSLSLESRLSTVVLLQTSGQVAYNPARVTRLLASLWRLHRQTYGTRAEAEMLYDLPAATGGDLASYTSLLQQFPAAYQLNGSDSNAAESSTAIAKRRQLKAYLMIFDQFMADALAQLGCLPQLFSLRSAGGQTWHARSLATVTGCDASLLIANYDKACESLRQRQDGGLPRQSAILNFLLSLSGQSLTVGLSRGESPACVQFGSPAVVEAQRLLLSNLPELSRDRGLGMNYRHSIYSDLESRERLLRDVSTEDQFTALERRCSLQALAISQLHDSDSFELVTEPGAATFGTLLLGSRSKDVRSCLQPIRPSPAVASLSEPAADSNTLISGQRIYAHLLSNLAVKLNYCVAVSATGSGYDLFCPDTDQGLWLLGTFNDDAAASQFACRLSEQILWHQHRHSANIYLIEWTLLRTAMDLPTSSNLQPDQFNQRVTAVVPQANSLANNGDSSKAQQDVLRQTLQQLLPAHVQLDLVRLGPQAYAQFLEIRRTWLMALADGQADDMAAQSMRMLRLISPQSIPDPPAPDPSPPSKGFGTVLLTWPQNTQAMGLMLSQPKPEAAIGMLLLLADSSTGDAANPAAPAALPPTAPSIPGVPSIPDRPVDGAAPAAAAERPAIPPPAAQISPVTIPAPSTAASASVAEPAAISENPELSPPPLTGQTPSSAAALAPPSSFAQFTPIPVSDPNSAVGGQGQSSAAFSQTGPAGLASSPAQPLDAPSLVGAHHGLGQAVPDPPTAPMAPGIPQPAAGPAAGVQPAIDPSGSIQSGAIPPGQIPAAVPPAVAPQAVTPEAFVPQAPVPQAVMPPAPIPQPGVAPAAMYPPTAPMASGIPQPAAGPAAGVQPAIVPSGSVQSGAIPPGQIPAAVPPAVAPQAVTPEAFVPQAPVPKAVMPPGPIPQPGVAPAAMYPPTAPMAPGIPQPAAGPPGLPQPYAVLPGPAALPEAAAVAPQPTPPPPTPGQAAWDPSSQQAWPSATAPWSPPPGVFDPSVVAQVPAGQLPPNPAQAPLAATVDSSAAGGFAPPAGGAPQSSQLVPGGMPSGPVPGTLPETSQATFAPQQPGSLAAVGADPRVQAPYPMAPATTANDPAAAGIPSGQALAAMPVASGPSNPLMPTPGQAAPPAPVVSSVPAVQFSGQPSRPQAVGLRLPQPAGNELLGFCRANRLEFLLVPLHGAAYQPPPASGDLARILSAGLAIMPICEPPAQSAGLNEQMGYSDALGSAAVARALALPTGLTIWFADPRTESAVVGCDAALTAYVRGWGRGLADCGYEAGLFTTGAISLSNQQVSRFCQLTSADAEPMPGFSMRRVQSSIPGLENYCQPALLYQILVDRRSTTPIWLCQAGPSLT